MSLGYWIGLRRATAATVTAFFLCLACLASATPLVYTNAAWRVTPTDPGAVPWNSSPAFDDSAWQTATVLADVGPPWSAQVIWSAGGQFSTTETQIWARQTFSLAGIPTSALLTVGCDDDCDVWVNGVQVVSDHNGFANNSSADILAYLTPGINLVALTVSDNFVVFGYNHGTWLQIDAQFAAPEPATLALLGISLAGLGFSRRRKR
jgi:hypothetical protein